MKETTRIQIAEMKKQTIGVEVEMNHITRSKAAKLAAEFFGTGRYEDTARRNGYYTVSAWDAQGREWKFQRDVSIAGPDSEKCELVTPILRYEDIETLQELIRVLRKGGAVSNPSQGCGVHIHIGANGHTSQTLRNLANIMASHESLLAEALKLDTNRVTRYCRTVDPSFLARLNKKKPATMAQLADIWYEGNGASYGRDQHYNDSRYQMTQNIVAENARIAQDQDEYQKRYNGLVQRYDAVKARYDDVVATISAKEAQSERLENFIKVLKAQDGTIREFDCSLWGSMVEFLTVGRNKEITVTFRDGTEIQA